MSPSLSSPPLVFLVSDDSAWMTGADLQIDCRCDGVDLVSVCKVSACDKPTIRVRLPAPAMAADHGPPAGMAVLEVLLA